MYGNCSANRGQDRRTRPGSSAFWLNARCAPQLSTSQADNHSTKKYGSSAVIKQAPLVIVRKSGRKHTVRSSAITHSKHRKPKDFTSVSIHKTKRLHQQMCRQFCCVEAQRNRRITTSTNQGNAARQDKACDLIRTAGEPADKHNRRCLCEGGCNPPLTTPVQTRH